MLYLEALLIVIVTRIYDSHDVKIYGLNTIFVVYLMKALFVLTFWIIENYATRHHLRRLKE